MSKKIKVLSLVYSMGNGGAQQVLVNNLKDLKDDEDIDFKVIVFCGPGGSKYDQIVKDEGLNVTYLGNPRSKLKIPVVRYPFNVRVARRAWEKVLKEEKPDIVHVHISELLKYTLKPIVKCGVPVRFDTLHSNPYRYTGRVLSIIRSAFGEHGFIPVCLNNEQVEQARDHYGISRYEIIHNGVDYKKIDSGIISREESRRQLGIGEDTLLLLGVGRLDEVKNYPLMIDVYKEVEKIVPNSRLMILGTGPLEAQLREQASGYEEKIIFCGNKPNVIPYYCAADKLLITSFSESASLVLIEAQCCGTACVISDGVPSESVISGKVQKLPKGADAKDWARVVLSDDRIVEQGCTKEDYEVHSCSEQLKDMYIRYWEEFQRK